MQSGVPFHLHEGGLTVSERERLGCPAPTWRVSLPSVAHCLGTWAGWSRDAPAFSRYQHPPPLPQDEASMLLSRRYNAAVLGSFSRDFT